MFKDATELCELSRTIFLHNYSESEHINRFYRVFSLDVISAIMVFLTLHKDYNARC